MLTDKERKGLFGSVLYAINESGYEVSLGTYENNTQTFYIKKYPVFEFVLYELSEYSEDNVCLVASVRNIGNSEFTNSGDVSYRFSVNINTLDIVGYPQKFIKNVLRHKYEAFYHITRTQRFFEMYPSKLKLRKWYKHNAKKLLNK